MQIEPAASATATLTVQDADLATALGSGDVPVLGTPRLVALCEQATVAAAAPCLDATETTVGVQVDLHHLAPSPLGAIVEARAELAAEQDGLLTFTVEASEDGRLVAEGLIERKVVDRQRFLHQMEHLD